MRITDKDLIIAGARLRLTELLQEVHALRQRFPTIEVSVTKPKKATRIPFTSSTTETLGKDARALSRKGQKALRRGMAARWAKVRKLGLKSLKDLKAYEAKQVKKVKKKLA